jgi:uncharacterized coiled-coil DUF342 family protein
MRLRGRLERLELIAKDLRADAEKRWASSDYQKRLHALHEAIDASMERSGIPEHERHLNRDLTPREEARLVETLDRLRARLERGELGQAERET